MVTGRVVGGRPGARPSPGPHSPHGHALEWVSMEPENSQT